MRPPHTPRPDRDPGRVAPGRVKGRHETGDVGRIMTEVGVHIDDTLKTVPPSLLEAFQDGASHATAALSHEHVQPRLPLRPLEREPACSIGGIIVDDQQLQVAGECQHGVDEADDVVPLVIGGRLHEHASSRPVGTGP